jgi:hypothetical protein
MTQAIAMHESGLRVDAKGSLGELGLYQIRPEFAKGYTKEQLLDPQTNVILGMQKILEAKRTCVHQNDIEYLICFNSGNTNAKKFKHPELAPYIKAVKRGMASL